MYAGPAARRINKKGPRAIGKGWPKPSLSAALRFSLEGLDVLCLPALGAFGNVKLDALTFLKCTKAV